jgi:hypothetical protein
MLSLFYQFFIFFNIIDLLVYGGSKTTTNNLIRKNIYLVCGNGEIARAFIQ